LEIDRRDDLVDPYQGYYARIVQEFAGVGGDTVFGKAELHAAFYQQIWNDLVWYCVYQVLCICLCLFCMIVRMQIKNALGIKKVQGQLETAV